MTEQVILTSICPSCGKNDKLLWPEGCNNAWHREGVVIVPQERIAALEKALKWALPFAESAPDPSRSEDDCPSSEWQEMKIQARAALEAKCPQQGKP